MCALIIFRRRFELYIGISHFFGLSGIFLKSLGICKKSIYYAIDYYLPPQGCGIFDAALVRISNFADKMAVIYSDEVWDISSRIADGRLKFSGIGKEFYAHKNRIVPLGYDKSFFRNKTMRDINRYTVIFVGVIVAGQGLELILEAMPKIRSNLPEIQVRVIGTGPFLNEFRELVSKNNMEEIFQFYGFIEEKDKMLDIISSSAVGISLWDGMLNGLNFYFGDPGKTKLYSVCGLPVIVSSDTIYSQVIMRDKAGIAIKYNEDELVSALNTMLLNDDVYKEYKLNAVNTASAYCSSEKIFSSVLN